MEVEVLSYTKNPEKTCALSMRSTRTKEPAHELWKQNWIIECPVKVDRKDYDICPREELTHEKCDYYYICAPRFLRLAKKMNHWGVFEHATFTISVSGISRSCTHQLVRHRLFSYLQSSSRRIDFSEFTPDDFIRPESFGKASSDQRFREAMCSSIKLYEELVKKGVSKEDARFILPQATPQHIVITGNARNWLHFFFMRMSKEAQWEIREMAKLIHKKLMEISPLIFEGAGDYEC